MSVAHALIYRWSDYHHRAMRASAFPVIKDLVVDRSAFDRIQQAGGYVSVNTGGVPDGNAIPVTKKIADEANGCCSCIGCGACVAACKMPRLCCSWARRFLSTHCCHKANPERKERVEKMVAQMDKEGFGSCTNTKACEAECPKAIKITNIARMNREYYSSLTLWSSGEWRGWD